MLSATPLVIAMAPGPSLSALLQLPAGAPLALLVLAHGAGAGMQHPFMAEAAEGFAARGVATLRFNFPFAEMGAKRPDSASVARRAVRTAVEEAGRQLPGTPLFAGGKSFGGRMTSQEQAEAPMAGVRGLVFLGFPLHPAGKPSTDRAAHLDGIDVPSLFVQGDRDALARRELVGEVLARLGARATLFIVEGADHGFHVPKRSGRTDAEALATILDTAVAWMQAVLAQSKYGI